MANCETMPKPPLMPSDEFVTGREPVTLTYQKPPTEEELEAMLKFGYAAMSGQRLIYHPPVSIGK